MTRQVCAREGPTAPRHMMDPTSISPLRQRMIEDMTARGLSRQTLRGHILACKRFAAYLKRSLTRPRLKMCACSSCS